MRWELADELRLRGLRAQQEQIRIEIRDIETAMMIRRARG